MTADRAFPLSFADILRTVWPESTAKSAAQAFRGSHRTVQDWIQSRCCPSADTLLKMAAENQELRAELIRRLEAFAHEDMVAAGPRPGLLQDRSVGDGQGRTARSSPAESRSAGRATHVAG